jgi:putative nucleotidyltransferase with HDIG domain
VAESPVSLGRDPECGIQLFDNAASRNHAEVFRIGEMCFVRDLGSRNATFVNEEKIEEELLRVGDKIRIGSTVIVFEDEEAEEEESSSPVLGVSFKDDDGEKIEDPFDEEEEEAEAGEEEFSEEDFQATIKLNLDRKQLGEIRAAGSGEDVAVHLGLLLELSKTISGETHLKPLMEKILKIAAEGIRAKIGILFLRDAKGGLIPRSHFGIEQGEDVKVSRTIVRSVFKHGRAVLTSDAAQDARFKQTESIVLQGIHSVICVPMVSRDQIIGILYFESQDVDHPFKPEDLDIVTAIGFQASVAVQNVLAQAQQRKMMAGAIRTLVAAVEMNSPETQGHSERVCTYAAATAEQLKLSDTDSQNVQLAALLHDIGKVATDSSDEEGTKVEEHVLLGVKLLENMPGMEAVIPGIKHHHEQVDGSGVPEGLTGDKIPQIAKIVAVANVLDHLMNMPDDEGNTKPTKEALLEMSKLGGKSLDAEVVAALFVAHRSGKLFNPKTIFEQAKPTA